MADDLNNIHLWLIMDSHVVKERNLENLENCVLLKARVLGYSLPKITKIG